ncbi:MAG: hypothetical protein JW876_12170 [Candidatus Krumholzibacteriota bacterium]|nr:hypothetical protein [Candidatus Krumholzibacteriota bacterium]
MKQTLIACMLVFFAVDAAAAPGVRSVFDSAPAGAPALVIASESPPGVGVAADALAEWSAAGDAVTGAYSPAKIGLASFLLPGLGQQRLGHTVRSRVYFALEGAAWVAIGSFLWQGYAREEAYRDYAVAFANIASADLDDDYYKMIAGYRSSDGPGGYNEYIRREARDLYPTDAEAMENYYEANAIVGDQSWRWENETAFDRYRDLRDGSRSSYRRALYAGVFAAMLRVVSTVDAVRLAQGANAEPALSLELDHRGGLFMLACRRSF